MSRSRVFQFQPLSTDDIKTLLRRALADAERGLGKFPVHLHDDALEFLAEVERRRRPPGPLGPGGRRAVEPGRVGRSSSRGSWPKSRCSARRSNTTAQGDAHYDSISALIKSIRGSDPDAALYWLARMLEGGEDVRFLARRLVILASEDVGNADPAALPLAVAAAQACELVGLPECQLNLAQAVTYLACAPKSNAATVGIGEARRDVREGRLLPVPVHLRERTTPARSGSATAKATNTPTTPGAVAAQDYLGVEREYYRPTDRGFEQELGRRLEAIRGAASAGKRRTRSGVAQAESL